MQRPHHFALVDEADNIFIDEARTPLIISSPTRPATEEEQIVFKWADKLVRHMQPNEHFYFDTEKQKLVLNAAGMQLARYSNPPSGPHGKAMDKLDEALEQALQAHYRFRRDQHYMVDKGKIVIIDEFTGRRMPDRHWREGLHQAVEAKEGVQINHPADHAAQITFQSYFRLYKKLAGMTGTALQNRWEVRRVYKIWVVCVPTNRPVRRDHWPDRVLPNEDAKFDAVVQEVARLRTLGRSVLIGTRSVEKSEKLSRALDGGGHRASGAQRSATRTGGEDRRGGGFGRPRDDRHEHGRPRYRHQAGPGSAGRRRPARPRHRTPRIAAHRPPTRRSCRTPGRSRQRQFFVSLEDELLEGLGPKRQERWKEFGRRVGNRDWDQYLPLFRRAQRRVERRHYRSRVDLLVHEKQRQEILKDIGADPYVD